ncbi:Rpn family recombination-promoting nuclease/putative transposase [Halomonas piscis]|uniref:Rpn family recombination-promoting nuclease/putative transposase n=1 Tax=Halomonas piscis TaxID=3031727 RepID=A0ABY9Z3E8_9GAMM|nr:Rpn family recombination-promoting nuclease/putative transposase [Halomonas piscis]WNK21215.1 Rpn family recombination-promoting nuclease/putative transposase [Halomonas piscis]
MASHSHDIAYKELFSHPEFVQQLIEGFAPDDIAALMDVTTLKQHNGHYVTPLNQEKIEDVVWSVKATWEGVTQRVYLYILLEFQSRVDYMMPVQMMHYVAGFHDQLIKNGVTTPSKGLPPVFPIVLYNGAQRWTAERDVSDMITPQPPGFLQPYQPHLRYYLVDEGRYSDEDLAERNSVLSGIFGIEKAKDGREALQKAVDRIVAIIQADPDKDRIDRIVTRWIKRHFERLGAKVDLTELNSLVEDRNMLADNLENWAKREREEGEKRGEAKGRTEGRTEGRIDTLRKLIELKFNQVPAWVDQRLEQASEHELNHWVEQILVADSLDVLFGD